MNSLLKRREAIFAFTTIPAENTRKRMSSKMHEKKLDFIDDVKYLGFFLSLQSRGSRYFEIDSCRQHVFSILLD